MPFFTIYISDGPIDTFATVSGYAVGRRCLTNNSLITVLSKSVSERLYVLDFRSSYADRRVFLILRFTYIFKYEDLNCSRKRSKV